MGDRHYFNFGAVRNAETLEWLGFAPVYDSGTSLWNDRVTIESTYKDDRSKSFYPTHEEQIKLEGDFSWLDFSALDCIEDEFIAIYSPVTFFGEERRTAILSAFMNRIESMKRYIKEKG